MSMEAVLLEKVLEAMGGAASTPAALSALADDGQLDAAVLEPKSIRIDLDAGAFGWVQLHDSAGVPANGAVCIREVYAVGPCTVHFSAIKFATRGYWCLSSTMRTKTITAFTLACAGLED